MAEIVITIDGPAGVGKTTVAKHLANRLGFTYVDTGAMYRALALIAQEINVTPEHEEMLGKLARELPLSFKQDGMKFSVFLDGRDVSEEIRSPQIGMLASTISKLLIVRKGLWELQRKLAQAAPKAIFEGRDMGTVVFPDAVAKFFLTASPEVRAKRRWKQLITSGKEVTYEEIYRSLLERDKQDMEREIAPLKPAPDAIVIDTSNLGIESVVNKMYQHILNKVGGVSNG
ncbi:MAG: (d)CMP kinase [Candidatus Desulfofervidaceae bacterium]|nr:(d)CMP kinase [Candidatus Desulfofervidaceae bacterium]